MDVTFFTRAHDVLLEAEVSPSKIAHFENNYTSATGVTPSHDQHYQRQDNKWGTECRIYFNCENDLNDEFADLDIEVESNERGYRGDRVYRVNNVEFFWALVNAGYRLGVN